MKGIGGNTDAVIQISTAETNEYGLQVQTWKDVQTLRGWLDLMSGDSRYRVYNAKIEESSHVFVCDYVVMNPDVLKAHDKRMMIDGEVYDITLMDNPMRLNAQWEIYLKYTGGQ